MSSSVEVAGEGAVPAAIPELPAIPLPQAPPAALLWSGALVAASVLVTLFTLDALTILFSDYWLLQSLDLSSVFWTNFRMGAWLYASAFVLFAAAIAGPRSSTTLRATRRFLVKRRFSWRRSPRTWRRCSTRTSCWAARD